MQGDFGNYIRPDLESDEEGENKYGDVREVRKSNYNESNYNEDGDEEEDIIEKTREMIVSNQEASTSVAVFAKHLRNDVEIVEKNADELRKLSDRWRTGRTVRRRYRWIEYDFGKRSLKVVYYISVLKQSKKI